ncbi:formate dehydrogenase subunit gamma [Pseudomonas putida]|uniref:formate dehydrogenase subunit gamma n=1 Tax=Pseudomonas putida TaxID=303 RepID=UPI0023639364|nr:formate dehydrogenase subunit gamma [Pseudomonas putida]MDD2055749.1 formate dehydrogenase subunit gamma [Pseudomonas putida]
MNKDKMILRTRFIERAGHWLMVLCFFAVALSGLSWFFPSFNGLNAVFGTPQLARILHPFFGVVVFLLLVFLFIRFVKYNLPEREDLVWFKNMRQVLSGAHDKPLQIGKYNAGQKLLFWGIMGLISLLLISGVLIWRPYFAPLFSIPTIRLGLVVHAVAGIALILLVIGHAYLAFWIKGSIRGMVTGYVTRSWAKNHHDRWYRQLLSKSSKPGNKP